MTSEINMKVVCLKKNLILAQKTILCFSIIKKAKGFLFVNKPTLDTALLFTTRAIHTCFMRFPITLLFLDCNLNIICIKGSVLPYRIIIGPRKTAITIELSNTNLDLNIGDKISIINGEDVS